MNKRGFMSSILALGAAPAIVRADSLMRVVAREAVIVTPSPWEVSSLGGYYSFVLSRELRMAVSRAPGWQTEAIS